MHIETFVEKIFAKAKSMNFEEYEVYFQMGNSLSLQSFENDIVSYSDSTYKGVNFRGTIKGKAGSCYSEVLDDNAVEMLVNKAYEAATLIENDDVIQLADKGLTYTPLELYNPSLENVSSDKKIAYVLEEETRAQAKDVVDKVQGSHYGDIFSECRLFNSKGVDIGYKQNQAYAYVSVIASEGDKKHSAFEYKVARDFNDIINSNIASDVAKRVEQKLGAKPVKTGDYHVILNNEASASLLSVFISAFSAEAVQKGMSLLKGQVGKNIASDRLTLIDDPHLKDGMASLPFDGEGIPTFKKSLIENGKLLTFLHNLNTAKKDGVKTTGNASRGSFKSRIGISPSNAYIKPSNMSLEEVMQRANEGLLITEFDGLHAGANAVTGDFSLSARGFVIESGKRGHAVNQIVVSGNYFDMLKQVKAVASDLKFKTEPIGSPSIDVGNLAVAGK